MTRLILIGAGGHVKVVKDIIAFDNRLEVFAIVDDAFCKTNVVDGIIYAHTSYLDSLDVERFRFFIAIGGNSIRKRLFDKLSIPIENYITLIHPHAIVSKTSQLGYGTVVMPNAVINADTSIANHCIINTNAIVEHDNVLGDYVHISPSATLSGVVNIGDGTHIGAGAVVIPGKSIGNWTTIGAGAVVTKDIPDGVTAVGVPAKIIKE